MAEALHTFTPPKTQLYPSVMEFPDSQRHPSPPVAVPFRPPPGLVPNPRYTPPPTDPSSADGGTSPLLNHASVAAPRSEDDDEDGEGLPRRLSFASAVGSEDGDSDVAAAVEGLSETPAPLGSELDISASATAYPSSILSHPAHSPHSPAAPVASVHSLPV